MCQRATCPTRRGQSRWGHPTLPTQGCDGGLAHALGHLMSAPSATLFPYAGTAAIPTPRSSRGKVLVERLDPGRDEIVPPRGQRISLSTPVRGQSLGVESPPSEPQDDHGGHNCPARQRALRDAFGFPRPLCAHAGTLPGLGDPHTSSLPCQPCPQGSLLLFRPASHRGPAATSPTAQHQASDPWILVPKRTSLQRLASSPRPRSLASPGRRP